MPPIPFVDELDQPFPGAGGCLTLSAYVLSVVRYRLSHGLEQLLINHRFDRLSVQDSGRIRHVV